jgi:hypothetical protein
MPPPVTPRQRLLVRGGLIALAALGLGVGFWVVATFKPSEESFYPKCVLHQFTGIHCTGCGFTRSLHSLANGDVSQAVAFNALSMLFFPYLALMGLRWAWRYLWDVKPYMPPPMAVNKWLMRALVTGVILFTILRNIPIEPFMFLAPHELAR